MVLVPASLSLVREDRLTSVCVLSAILAAGYFLLLAQKKVTKEKGTLGFAPSPTARVRYGRTGFAHRPSMACCRNRRDPSRRPRAVHAAVPSALRRCSEGTRRAKAKSGSHCGYIRRRLYPLLRQGLPRSALPGFPLGRGKDAEEKPRSGGRQDAGHFDESTWMCSRRSPPSPCVVCRGMDAPADRDREGAFFFGYFLLGKQKKVTGGHGWRQNTHGRESVIATAPKAKVKMDSGFRRNDERWRTPSPPNPPLEGEG